VHYWNALNTPANFDSTGVALIDLVGSTPAARAGDTAHWALAWGAGADATVQGAVKAEVDSANSIGWRANGVTSFTSTFTFEMMFQYLGPGTTWTYFNNRSGGPVGIRRNNGTGAMYVDVGGGGTPINGTVTWTPTVNTWYDMAVTGDGSALSLYITPYSPTATTATLLKSVAYSGTPTSAVGLAMGDPDASKYGVAGYVDWGAVSNTALSATDLGTNIARNSPTPEPATMGVLAIGGLVALMRRRRQA